MASNSGIRRAIMSLHSMKYLKSSVVFYRLVHTSPVLQHLKVGDTKSLTKTITMEDVRSFADLTLDNNPIHVDPEYAKTTRFGKPIVHGLFGISVLGGLLGGESPGPGSILMGLTMEFTAPLFVGDMIKVETVIKKIEGRKVTYEGICYAAKTNEVVTKGEIYVLVPKHLVKNDK